MMSSMSLKQKNLVPVKLHSTVHSFSLATHLISDLANIETSFVSDGNNSFVRLFHQVTDDLVVKVLYVLPSNALTPILLLLLL